MIPAIVRFAIRFPGVVVAAAIVLAVYGVYALTRASLDVFPEFSPTQVVIQTEAPGLSAELVEALVSQPIENAVGGVAGVESMRSQSIPGLSVVTLIFREGTDIYRDRQLVAERLAAMSRRLPAGIAAPAITPLTSSASTVLGVGLTSKTRSLTELRTLTDWTVRPHLLAVEGVADVNVFGGKVHQFQVQADPEKLRAWGLSLTEVAEAARQATGVRGAGFVENANQRLTIATEGQALTPEALARAVIAMRGQRPVTLGDVATVTEGAAPSISAAAIDGEPGVFLFIQGQLGANTKAVTASLEKALGELEPLLAEERVTLHKSLFRPANFIETAVANVQRDILIGTALVIAILFLFLFNWRTAFISTTAIPLSLLAAALVLFYFGVSLNIMVMGGLAIALGEVVDDAIIDTENIFRRLRQNRLRPDPLPVPEVVLRASLEVRSSVVYATFIVALVFVPLLTLSGVAGRLFAPLGFAYILAILASLVVAITLTPALCLLMLGRQELEAEDPPLIRFVKPRYARLLAAIERRPGTVMAAVGLVLTAGMAVLPLFQGEFIPPLREGHYVLHMTAVPGTSEQESLRIGKRVSEAVLAIDGVQSVAQWVGRAEAGADTFGTHYSEYEVEIGALPGDEQKRILREIREVLAGESGAYFPGVSFGVNTFLTERIEETVTGYAAAFVVNLYGRDLDLLDREAQAVAQVLGTLRGARDVAVQAPPGAPQLTIRLRPARLEARGVPPLAALEAVQAAYEGAEVGQVYVGGRVVDVVVRLDPQAASRITRVGELTLKALDGRLVPLSEVADIRQETGRYKILHEAGKRLQTVTANVEGRDVEAFAAEARKRIAERVQFAPGHYPTYTGAAEAQARAREDLIVHSLLAGVGIFLLLYVAFNNLRNLAVTVVNLPFALFGGVLAVLAGGGWMSLGALVGFVTLFGITLRNSIMLVSHYQWLVQQEGHEWNAATMLQGAQERLPSILMTALVAAIGLAPLAVGSGEPGREIEGPMAMVIIGGLATSTILNLLVLPTILLHFGDFRRRVA